MTEYKPLSSIKLVPKLRRHCISIIGYGMFCGNLLLLSVREVLMEPDAGRRADCLITSRFRSGKVFILRLENAARIFGVRRIAKG